jgi:4-carboxymuconolactone decarboxylase
MMGNVFRALANSPGALDRVAGVGEYARFESDLDDRLREAVILTVAGRLGCLYEWTHHWHLAQRAGVDFTTVDPDGATTHTETDGGFAAELALARLVADGGPVPDDLLDRVRERLGDRGLVDLVVLVGYYGLLARFINTLHVPLEDGVEPVAMPATEEVP